MKQQPTKYYGIYRTYDDDLEAWFLSETGNGADKYFGLYRPTDYDVRVWRDDLVGA